MIVICVKLEERVGTLRKYRVTWASNRVVRNTRIYLSSEMKFHFWMVAGVIGDEAID